MRFAVIGAGSWGTTLADLLARNGHGVRLWAREPEVFKDITEHRRNRLFVPDLEIASEVEVTQDLPSAIKKADGVVFAIPSMYVRPMLKLVKPLLPPGAGVVNVAKGLETQTGAMLSQIFLKELGVPAESPEDRIAVLSGPNLAGELAVRKAGATVIACPNEEWSLAMQKAFSTPYFRVYRHRDRIGVELGGTLKNVFSIGAGIVDGLNLGDNAKAAYLTRSVHEMVRLGTRLGGKPQTFYGLSGLGDLMATASSPLSRNHRLGQALAKGKAEDFFSSQSRMVVEGVETTRMAFDWGKRLSLPLPITEEIFRVLFEKKSPREAAKDLMTRSLKDEEE